MDLTTFLLSFAVIACAYMACNIGANDVANAMGTSVASKTFTYKQAVVVAGFAEFFGAFLVGGHVSDTIRKGMMDPTFFSGAPFHLVYGMIAALVAAAVWLHIASYLGWPVSTTHSIVGAVVGFGVIAGGLDIINWPQVGKIIMSWVISPLMGGLCSFLMFRFISKRIFDKRVPLVHAKAVIPHLVFLVFVILVNAVVYKGLKNLHLDLQFTDALALSCIVGLIGWWVARLLIKRIKEVDPNDIVAQHQSTENIFKYLQAITAFYVAFAHGSNDVANAVGPLASVASILQTGAIQMQVEMPMWILGLGGGCIVLGLFIWGRKVMRTIGEEITEITPSRGFSAEFGAATVVLICSKMGLPISTTHTLVGSVIGVGMARGLAALNLAIIQKIFISWIATIPFTAILAMVLYRMFLIFLP